MGKIIRAVQGIDVPGIGQGAHLVGAFLADETVIGKRGPQPLDDERLGRQVELGHEVDGRAFGLDIFFATKPVHQQRARVAGDRFGRPENVIEVHIVLFSGAQCARRPVDYYNASCRFPVTLGRRLNRYTVRRTIHIDYRGTTHTPAT